MNKHTKVRENGCKKPTTKLSHHNKTKLLQKLCLVMILAPSKENYLKKALDVSSEDLENVKNTGVDVSYEKMKPQEWMSLKINLK